MTDTTTEPLPTMPGRIVLVGNADSMNVPDERIVDCERCNKHTAIINKYQQAKMVEVNLRYAWTPTTAGGKKRAPMVVFCWECARDIGIKSRAVPVKMR
jgi:hypothetical protein